MIYIQIPEEHDAIGFLELAKSGIQFVAYRKTYTAFHPSIFDCSDESAFL